MPKRREEGYFQASGKTAFSLVEVVLAIGIVSVAILVILGVLSVGLQSSREASEDTFLALSTQQLAAWSKSQTFSNLAVDSLASSNSVFYFNAQGVLARTSDGAPATAPAADSHYLCTVKKNLSGISTNFLHLQYRFEWPLAAPAPSRQYRIVVASRANED